jgi:hypothetical protein
VIRVAQEHFHGLGIEPSGDLLGGYDRGAFAGNFSKAATLKLVLQGFALSFGAFEYCIGVADHVRQRVVWKIMKTRYGRIVGSLCHWSLLWRGLGPGRRSTSCLDRLFSDNR